LKPFAKGGKGAARVFAGNGITGYEYRLIEASSTRREVMGRGIMDPAEASWHPLAPPFRDGGWSTLQLNGGRSD
jgi:hypothetical protein